MFEAIECIFKGLFEGFDTKRAQICIVICLRDVHCWHLSLKSIVVIRQNNPDIP